MHYSNRIPKCKSLNPKFTVYTEKNTHTRDIDTDATIYSWTYTNEIKTLIKTTHVNVKNSNDKTKNSDTGIGGNTLKNMIDVRKLKKTYSKFSNAKCRYLIMHVIDLIHADLLGEEIIKHIY